MEIVKSFAFKDGHKLEIHHDESAESPRQWDNMGVMALFHPDYDLGDKGHGLKTDDFAGWAEMSEWIARKMDGAIILPVRMYDHSGIRFAVGEDCHRYPFNCPWDSMQVGFIYVTKAKLIEEYGSDDDDARTKGLKCLKAEIEVYNQFSSGDVYGFILKDSEGVIDGSCWGFFGDFDNPIENGIADHLDSKYQSELVEMV